MRFYILHLQKYQCSWMETCFAHVTLPDIASSDASGHSYCPGPTGAKTFLSRDALVWEYHRADHDNDSVYGCHGPSEEENMR